MDSIKVFQVILHLVSCIFPQISPKPWHSTKDNDPLELATKDSLVLASGKFFMLRKRMNWLDSLDACETFCSTLATLPTKKDAETLVTDLRYISNYNKTTYFTATNVYEFQLSRRYWVGLNDLGKEGKWLWTTDGREINYDFWYPGQPDHVGKSGANFTGEHCVVLWNPLFYKNQTHTFNDEPCLSKHYAICNDPVRRDDDCKHLQKRTG